MHAIARHLIALERSSRCALVVCVADVQLLIMRGYCDPGCLLAVRLHWEGSRCALVEEC